MYLQNDIYDGGLGIFGLKKLLFGGGGSNPDKAYKKILRRQAKTARIFERNPESGRIEKRQAKTARIAEKAGLTLPCPTCEPLFPEEPAPPTVAPQPPHPVTAPQSMVAPQNVVSVPASPVPLPSRYSVNLPAPISPVTQFVQPAAATNIPSINITTPGGSFQPAASVAPEAPESNISKWIAPAGILAAVTVFMMMRKKK